MQTDLQKRILANVLLDPNPEHVLLPRRRGLSIGSVVSLGIFTIAASGLVLLVLTKLQMLPH